jgi:hypothetical protein
MKCYSYFIFQSFCVALTESPLLVGILFKQDRQCTYNVTLRRVRVTFVAVEMQ